MNFQQFLEAQHLKEVSHFIKFCNAGHAPTTENAMHIFGYCAKDVKLIVADTIAVLASKGE